MSRKHIILLSLLFISVIALIGIMANGGKNEDNQTSQPDKQPDQIVENVEKEDTEEEEEIKVVPTNINPLTGIGDMSEEGMGGRPVAVMINNVDDALPQYGIADADIIFEIPVEAYLTRLMAIYADYTKVPYICSVRSCREYFPAFSEGFDAIYVSWGGAKGTEEYMKSLGTTYFYGYNLTLYGRDQERMNNGYKKEHSSYFDGTKLVSVLEERGLRTEIEEDKQGDFFKFHEYFQQVKPSDTTCYKMHVEFGTTTATLIYDEKSNTYLKEVNGKKQMDGIKGTQLAFTNVFLLETSITTNADGLHKDVIWQVEKGTGYYLSNGCIQPIFWTKTSENDKLVFYNENGEELILNRGKTYIAVTNKGRTTFE